jgi:hypothetical protein
VSFPKILADLDSLAGQNRRIMKSDGCDPSCPWMFLVDLFKSGSRLEVEIVFLRHQLNIALQQAPHWLSLRDSDRPQACSTMGRKVVAPQVGRRCPSDRVQRQKTMSDSNSDAPNVRIVPPLVYLAGLAVGFLANVSSLTHKQNPHGELAWFQYEPRAATIVI